MGLAASQARFLCITARKADCEYKSTDLAQQKLEITNQLSDISNEYSNAMNSTKLIWDNENVANPAAVDYALLMTHSAANDYNPYMLTTASGAIVLNSTYAAAAKAAGISKSGGLGSQASRNKFISALAYQGIITEETAKSIVGNLYPLDEAATEETGQIVLGELTGTTGVSASIPWNPIAGMGDEPKEKYAADDFTLSEMCMSDIGTTLVDWAQVLAGEGQVTELEYETQMETYNELIASAKQENFTSEVIGQLNMDYYNYSTQSNPDQTKLDNYMAIILLAQNYNNVNSTTGYIESNGTPIKYNGKEVKRDEALNLMIAQGEAGKNAYQTAYGDDSGKQVSLDDADSAGNKFNTSSNNINDGKLSVASNGIIQTGDDLSEITISDILVGNITLISGSGKYKDAEVFKQDIVKIFDQIVAKLGYVDGTTVTGVGLNVDEESASALSFAYNMIIKRYLNAGQVADVGGDSSSTSMVDNAAFENAEEYNRIGTNSGKNYYAVSLSNMLSAFLTYYDNGLMGADSAYVVGETVETSSYVTEDANYVYLGNLNEETYEKKEKVADFYDILYNNIIENGWREDVAIDDSEYLEQCIKNGTYSMTSLNMLDGYYYQTRYNETGYFVEVSDTDAIARAEAEFNAKKAELTYKEDKIDLKTKQLDAEISSLSTEYETVKSLISRNVEKTFTMFQN